MMAEYMTGATSVTMDDVGLHQDEEGGQFGRGNQGQADARVKKTIGNIRACLVNIKVRSQIPPEQKH
jgi:hypothetical protein